MAEKMDLAAVEEAVSRDLPGWTVHGGGAGGDSGTGHASGAGGDGREAISRQVRLRNFREAFAFMTEVALLAEAADHHPELRNVWREVEVVLTTHSAGGVTEADLRLARKIEKVVWKYFLGVMDKLLDEKRRHEWSPDSAKSIPHESGIYAIFLADDEGLPADLKECVKKRVRNDGLLYVGISGDLEERLNEHFTSKTSGFSTLRRSVGALLKDHLGLKAVSRDPNKKESNRFCFDTDDGSEGRLNGWMQKWLRFSCYPVEGINDRQKAKVIRYLAPPLNRKKGNPSPCILLESEIKECQNEAKRNRLAVTHQGVV